MEVIISLKNDYPRNILIIIKTVRTIGLPGGSGVYKHPPVMQASASNRSSIPESGRSLEKETATHASILAWEIPWTEEPGGLYSPWGCKRVGHDLATKQQQGP